MQKKKLILAIAIIAVLATVSVVAADEAGIFTINIFNNPNSQLYTAISNSTIQGQTNYTNSNAVENITLTNSTLTITVNGQNITFTSQGDNLTIQTPNQTTTITPNSNNVPLLSVSYLASGNNQHSIITGNGTYNQYDFNVTVGVPTSVNYPFGREVSHEALNTALTPLIDKYALATRNEVQGGSTALVVSWVNTQIVGGESRFSLFSYNNLTTEQIQSLTIDLYSAFTSAMSR